MLGRSPRERRAGADLLRKGERATVTDANLVLGRLDAELFLGGAVRLDEARAKEMDGAAGVQCRRRTGNGKCNCRSFDSASRAFARCFAQDDTSEATKCEMRGFFPFDKLRIRMTASPKGMTVEQYAAGIVRLAETTMEKASA